MEPAALSLATRCASSSLTCGPWREIARPLLVPRCVNWRTTNALRVHGEKAEIPYADFRNEVLAN
jgi:hypothetical protein